LRRRGAVCPTRMPKLSIPNRSIEYLLGLLVEVGFFGADFFVTRFFAATLVAGRFAATAFLTGAGFAGSLLFFAARLVAICASLGVRLGRV
jgi:hypothetical protein